MITNHYGKRKKNFSRGGGRAKRRKTTPRRTGSSNTSQFNRVNQTFYKRRRGTKAGRRRSRRSYKQFINNTARVLANKQYKFTTSTNQGFSANSKNSVWAVAIGTGLDSTGTTNSPNSDLSNIYRIANQNVGQDVSSNQHMILTNMTIEFQITNQTSYPLNIDVYTIYPKKDHTNSIQTTLIGGQDNARIDSAVLGLSTSKISQHDYGFSPFTQSQFGEYFTIFKQQRIFLDGSIGKEFSFQKRLNHNKILKNTYSNRAGSTANYPVLKKSTMGYLFIARRTGTDAIVNGIKVESTRSYTTKFLQTSINTYTKVTNGGTQNVEQSNQDEPNNEEEKTNAETEGIFSTAYGKFKTT